MNKVIIFLLALFSVSSSFSQDINFNWVKQLDRRTGLDAGESYFIGTDSLHDVYVAGNFRNTMNLDPGTGTANVTSQWDNVFICKLDPFGNFIWGKQLGGDRFTLCQSLFVDAAGNVYTTGYFTGTADFDPGPGVYNLSAAPNLSPEDQNIFVSKLDANGNFQWAKGIGALGADAGSSITADQSGNVYVTGYFEGIVNFNPGGVSDAQGSVAIRNAFITKYNAAGNYIFTRTFTGGGNSIGRCIRTDDEGNIYTVGYFGGATDFDPGAGQVTLPDNGISYQPYFSKLDSAGHFILAKSDVIDAYDLAVDANQNVYFYGGQSCSKYNAQGSLLWRDIVGTTPAEAQQFSNIALDRAGNVYLTGLFRYTQDFDPGPATYNMTALGGGYPSDVAICRLDPNGKFVWAKQFGGYVEDYATGIWIDNSGNVYTTGIYAIQADFDPGPGIYNLIAFTGGGIFIHKMSPCANQTASSLYVTECNSYTLNNVSYDSSGIYTQTLSNRSGCDSILTLHLSITNSHRTDSAIACNNYWWQGKLLTASGIYEDTLTSINGCDSILRLHLTIKSKTISSVTASVCEGQNFEGYTLAGTYIDTFTGVNGCDSIRTLYLTVNSKKYSSLSLTICEGGSFSGHTETGTYIDTFVSANGCDSIQTLTLIVNKKSFSDISETICAGKSYLGYTSTGTYQDTLSNVNGCDSIRTLHLTVTPASFSTIRQSICEGQTYLGHSIAGTYIDTLQASSGCDSIVTVQLSILQKPVPQFGMDASICSGDTLQLSPGEFPSYLWQDGTTQPGYRIKTAGLYSVTVTNECGSGYDEIMITEKDCKTNFPSAFTPNQDGKNDRFTILHPYNISNFHLVIYNRFGQKIFETNDDQSGWDGTYKSQPCDIATYIWYCDWKEAGISKHRKGAVLLLR